MEEGERLPFFPQQYSGEERTPFFAAYFNVRIRATIYRIIEKFRLWTSTMTTFSPKKLTKIQDFFYWENVRKFD